MGPPDAEDLPALAGLAVDPHPDVAFWAVTLLGRLHVDATAAVPVLIDVLENAEATSVRQRTAWALGEIGPAAAAALPTLHEATESGDSRLARLANEAIGRIKL